MTVPQVPAGVLLDGMPPQYVHVPAQLVLQQTPSMQFPVPHWSVAVQLVPFPYFDVQVPPRQKPLTQSVSAAQVADLHAVPEAQTTLPVQADAAGCAQTPAPLQLPLGVSRPALHERLPHVTLVVA